RVPVEDGARQRRVRPADAGRAPRRARAGGGGVVGQGRGEALRGLLPVADIGRHEAARVDRPRVGQRAGGAADGRAAGRARRADARGAAGGTVAVVGGDAQDGALRHPLHRRGGAARRPRGDHDRAPRHQEGRVRGRPAAPARHLHHRHCALRGPHRRDLGGAARRGASRDGGTAMSAVRGGAGGAAAGGGAAAAGPAQGGAGGARPGGPAPRSGRGAWVLPLAAMVALAALASLFGWWERFWWGLLAVEFVLLVFTAEAFDHRLPFRLRTPYQRVLAWAFPLVMLATWEWL